MRYEIAGAAIWGTLVAGGGAFLTELTPWYRQLKKPSWQPPDWLFGPAWTLILALASWSAYLAWRDSLGDNARLLVLGLFAANGFFNLLWSPLFFKLRRPDWALYEVPFLWLSVLAPMVVLAPVNRSASLLLVPYLLWVTFAALLNMKIVSLNAPFATNRS